MTNGAEVIRRELMIRLVRAFDAGDLAETIDRIEFCVGTKVNEAHQDPNLPAELDLRRNVLHDIAAALETRYRKQTTFHFY